MLQSADEEGDKSPRRRPLGKSSGRVTDSLFRSRDMKGAEPRSLASSSPMPGRGAGLPPVHSKTSPDFGAVLPAISATQAKREQSLSPDMAPAVSEPCARRPKIIRILPLHDGNVGDDDEEDQDLEALLPPKRPQISRLSSVELDNDFLRLFGPTTNEQPAQQRRRTDDEVCSQPSGASELPVEFQRSFAQEVLAHERMKVETERRCAAQDNDEDMCDCPSLARDISRVRSKLKTIMAMSEHMDGESMPEASPEVGRGKSGGSEPARAAQRAGAGAVSGGNEPATPGAVSA